MKLGRLLTVLDEKEFRGDEQYDIISIVSHSACVREQSLFVAIPGSRVDGHNFLEAAYQAGVRAFVTQRPFFKPDASTIVVPDARHALALLAAEFYGQPTRAATLIGITGTNGKTTTTYLIERILQHAGYPVGVLGTVEYRYGSRREAAGQTTPEPMALQKVLREMIDDGVRHLVMEVSSQGLDQRRVDGCQFDVGIFTNLSPEHLDYHETLDNYYLSKERFFTRVLAGSAKKKVRAIINQDDPMGECLLGKIRVPHLSFGVADGDIHAQHVSLTSEGISADLCMPGATLPIRSSLLGTFNLYNILAAAAAALALDIPAAAIRSGIEAVDLIPGRMERIENQRGMLILVDYAHTGDALENALKTLKDIAGRRIITVFGCGGDRDREKRPVMGRVAAHYSDIVVITSDNPRSEAAEKIIEEIEAGVREAGLSKAADRYAARSSNGKTYVVYPDRAQAIHEALALAVPGDSVLIAGKGHESTQQIGGQKFSFDDREVARCALQQLSVSTG
jgi:UDP-N-acetylmuramoyl-L-alanyl-D-glutamate--2,6-diaminopimelate ligase